MGPISTILYSSYFGRLRGFVILCLFRVFYFLLMRKNVAADSLKTVLKGMASNGAGYGMA